MRFAILFLLSILPLPGQAFRSLQFAANPGVTSLKNHGLGSFQWSFRFHNLPTVPTGTDRILVSLGDGVQNCRIPANTLSLICYDSFDAGVDGSVIVPLPAGGDARVVVTRKRDVTYGTIQIDLWKGDCSGHVYSRMRSLYQNGEPATSSGEFSIGGFDVGVGFFRISSAISPVPPTCPGDIPTAASPVMDFRFEGDSLKDVSGKNYTLSAPGSSFADSPAFGPAAIIGGSWTAPRPVVPVEPFGLDGSPSVTSVGTGAPVTYLWTQISGPAASSFSSTTSATPTVTPPQEGSYTYQLTVTDSSGATGIATINVGVVASDSSGIKIWSNPDLAYVLGSLPRYGVNPWPWYDLAEAGDMDTLYPYWTAAPAPGTLFAGSGLNDAYFTGRGPFGGTLTDAYDVRISAVGSPDSYQWRKNGGAWSNSIPITLGGVGRPSSPVTDGVVISFNALTGHTLNDQWTRQAPYEGTASISDAAPNHIDGSTGYICGAVCGNPITVVGSETHWLNGTVTQKLHPGDQIWLEWDADGPGSRTGRWIDSVASVVDDTHFTIGGAGGVWQIPVSLTGSMTIQKIGPDLGGYTLISQPASSWNYYEALLGGIRLAEATNLEVYNQQSQTFCNLWWQYGLDHGYRGTTPRNSGYQSMIACATKYGYDWWDGIARLVGAFNPGSPVSRNAGRDIRETSYQTRATALLAHLYPAHTGNPADTKSVWCGYLANQANNYWLNPSTSGGILTTVNNGQDAYFQENLCTEHCGFPAAGNPPGPANAATFGTSPWRDSGLANIALIEAYRALNDSEGCNNSAVADAVASTVEKSTRFVWDYGRSPDGGLYYNTEYLSMQGVRRGDVLHMRPDIYDQTSSVTVTGGTQVTGNNTHFTKTFAPCDGSSRISINGGASVAVASCQDDTHMTLASEVPNISGSSYYNAGSVTVTNGSNVVVGTGTGFLNLFAPCDGSTFIGLTTRRPAPDASYNAVYQVTSCEDNTHLTLSRAYEGETLGGISEYSRSNRSSENCAPSIGSKCEAEASGGRLLAHDYPASLSWNFVRSGMDWKSKVEYGLGKLYGGAVGGPGSLGPGAGPQADGDTSNFDGPMPACVLSQIQPCSYSPHSNALIYGHAAKEFGMSAGAGNARNAIAEYLIRSGFGVKSQSTTMQSTTVP